MIRALRSSLVVGNGAMPGTVPLTIFFIGIAAIAARAAMRFVTVTPPRRDHRAASRPRSARRRLDGYLLSIAVVIAMSSIVTPLVDYQFKMIASDAIGDEASLVGFFGGF